MKMKDVLKKLREKNSLTQEQMAKRVMVTRQSVSRWETGESQTHTDTLKLLSHTGANGETCDGYQTVCQSLGNRRVTNSYRYIKTVITGV